MRIHNTVQNAPMGLKSTVHFFVAKVRHLNTHASGTGHIVSTECFNRTKNFLQTMTLFISTSRNSQSGKWRQTRYRFFTGVWLIVNFKENCSQLQRPERYVMSKNYFCFYKYICFLDCSASISEPCAANTKLGAWLLEPTIPYKVYLFLL
jgi:hypothetical protein